MTKNILKFKLLLFAVFFFCGTSMIHPETSFSKPSKVKKTSKSRNVESILPNTPSSTGRESSPQIDPIPSDILQVLQVAKQYKGSQSEQKSQLETQAQYEARIASSQSNLPEIEITVPADEEFSYNAEKAVIVVGMKTDYTHTSSSLNNQEMEKKALRRHQRSKTISTNEITCTNGYGAKFNYLHTFSSDDEFGIAYVKNDLYRNTNDPSWSDVKSKSAYSTFKSFDYRYSSEYGKYEYGSFEFKIPMNIDEVRRNITVDEKKLNGNLKFIVNLKPIFPFYVEDTYSIGSECGEKYTTNGRTYTALKKDSYALFEITNLKLIDFSNNKVLLERNYRKK
jgi:hypothetical protein